MTTAAAPIVSAPLVWVELITSAPDRASDFYRDLLGWKAQVEGHSVDRTVYLDPARVAGPICGIRPRSPSDPIPIGTEGLIPDRWSVRLSPPRPPLAADPGGDQLLRPRSPGPRLGRWGVPNALCFMELRTPDVEGAEAWMSRRLDAVFRRPDPADGAAEGTLMMQSSVDPERPIAALARETDPALAGWVPCIQVAALAASVDRALAAGAQSSAERAVPAGCPGTGAVELVDVGGSRVVLVEHGPVHGRR